MKQYTFSLNAEPLTYTLYQRARMNHIHITVKNGMVRVSAPFSVSVNEVESFLRENTDKILQMLRENPYRMLLNRSSILLLGKPYEVCIISSPASKIEEIGGKLILFSDDPGNEEKNKRMVTAFLRGRAKVLFSDVVKKFYPLIEPYGIPMPNLQIRQMTSRWGSCRPSSGNISLNLFLMAAPIPCIEYVVIHELVHLIYPNHSKSFWNMVEKIIPDYKQMRDYINKNLKTEIMVMHNGQ